MATKKSSPSSCQKCAEVFSIFSTRSATCGGSKSQRPWMAMRRRPPPGAGRSITCMSSPPTRTLSNISSVLRPLARALSRSEATVQPAGTGPQWKVTGRPWRFSTSLKMVQPTAVNQLGWVAGRNGLSRPTAGAPWKSWTSR